MSGHSPFENERIENSGYSLQRNLNYCVFSVRGKNAKGRLTKERITKDVRYQE